MEKYKILLIEDHEGTGEMVKKSLEVENMLVDWAKNGDEALAIFEAGKYDLIISDLKMPNKTGDMVIAEIRKIDEFVSILVYTNYEDEPKIMRNLLNLQVSGYYQKGGRSNVWELVEKAKNILEPFSEEKRERFLNQLPSNPFENTHD
jgi:DNA-binding response OmpR family regulator